MAADAQEGAQTREALLTALAMNECEVTEGETVEVFGSQGFDGEYVRHELGQMILDGTAFLEGGSVLRVFAPHCPPADPVPTPAQALRAAIADAGCSATEAEVRAMGFEAERLRPVVARWVESGDASVEWKTLKLADCP